MSDLNFSERSKLERLLKMGGGYVLDFTDRTFQEFVHESTGVNIYDEKFDVNGSSKAKHLRAFFALAPNYQVGKLLKDLMDHLQESGEDRMALEEGYRISERLLQNAPVPNLEAIVSLSDSRDFEVLSRQVKEAIERNSPESGLDRLHTFVVKYVRTIAEKRGIPPDRDKPLHAVVGEYIKRMKELGLIESEMTERILKSSISNMEYFNRVRNEQSLAHDNPLLNHSESLLIFNHITSTIAFLQALEEIADKRKEKPETSTTEDEVPF